MNLEIDITTADRILNAMMFCIGPYLDDHSIREHPWIEELAESYNELVVLLPRTWKLEHHQIISF